MMRPAFIAAETRMGMARKAACDLDDGEKKLFLAKYKELTEQVQNGGHDEGTIFTEWTSCFYRAGWRVEGVVDRTMPRSTMLR